MLATRAWLAARDGYREAERSALGVNAPIAGTPQLTGLGRAVLATISALDSGPAVAPPSMLVMKFARNQVLSSSG